MPKEQGEKTPEKLQRNRVYKVCGIIMLTCIVLLALYFNIRSLREQFGEYRPVFYPETVALLAFGFSSIVEGEVILKD